MIRPLKLNSACGFAPPHEDSDGIACLSSQVRGVIRLGYIEGQDGRDVFLAGSRRDHRVVRALQVEGSLRPDLRSVGCHELGCGISRRERAAHR